MSGDYEGLIIEKPDDGKNMRNPQFAWKDRIQVICVLVLYALIAGSAFLFTSETSKYIPPFTLCALRLGFGGIGLVILTIAFYREQLLKINFNRDFLIKGATMGVFNTFIPYSAYPYSYQFGAGVGISAVFSGATPFFVFLWFLAMGKSNRFALLRWENFVGLLIGSLGVVVASLSDFGAPNASWWIILGYSLLVLYASSKGFASVFGSLYLHDVDILPIACVQNITGFGLALICSLTFDVFIPPAGYPKYYGFFGETTVQTWIGVCYLGFMSSMIVYILQFYLLKKAGAIKQSVVDYLTPVVGIVEGALFAGDWDGVTVFYIISELMGSVLLLIGVAFIHLGPNQREHKVNHINEQRIVN